MIFCRSKGETFFLVLFARVVIFLYVDKCLRVYRKQVSGKICSSRQGVLKERPRQVFATGGLFLQ